jgi:hypothetical protein
MNELSFIDKLDEIENQFIIFVKMISVIHWSKSPKKMVKQIYSLWVKACLSNPKKSNNTSC